jgi:hypothetical protein
MQYRLRTLLIVLAILPPILALFYWIMPILPWLAVIVAVGIMVDSFAWQPPTDQRQM